MTAVANVQKVFNFRVIMAGVDIMEVQECTLPEKELNVVEHGGANFSVKTASRVKTGDLTLKLVKPILNVVSDQLFWRKLELAQNDMTETGGLPSIYKESFEVHELNPDGISVRVRYLCVGAFVKKISQSGFNRTSDDNTIREIVFSVDKCTQI